ncbi:OmpW family protein [Aquabacterium sp.]|uniref:OmpW/AlkL family protein n=1 Tax=Aquabacterium sp. TaxID=1872578 RepID=UPI0035AFBB9A
MESKVKVGFKQIGLATALVASLGASGAHAEDMSTSEASTGLTLKLEPAHHKFMRYSYIYIKPNTKTSPTKDVTGPLISKADADCLAANGCKGSGFVPTYNSFYPIALGSTLSAAMAQDGVNGIGLPTGISAEAKGAGSLAISAGAFLDPEEKWSTELYVFALPFDNVVEGGGMVTEVNNSGVVQRVRQNYITGKSIIKTKQLPPTAVFSYYFLDKKSDFRPFLGLGVTYAMFFDTQATSTLETYSGGPTEVKLKNAFGAGPFGGLQYRLTDKLHLSAQLGYVKLKTAATMTTQTTVGGLANSPVLQDFSGIVGEVNRDVLSTTSGKQILWDGLSALQNYRGGTLGTYVRKQDTKLDPYIMTLSVGYDF